MEVENGGLQFQGLERLWIWQWNGLPEGCGMYYVFSAVHTRRNELIRGSDTDQY